MPRKPPTEVIEHRISLSDFERRELKQYIDAQQVNAGINVVGGILQSVSFPLLALAALTWVGFSLTDLVESTKVFVDDSSTKVKGWFEKNGYVNYQADELGREIDKIQAEMAILRPELAAIGTAMPPETRNWDRYWEVDRQMKILADRETILRKMLNDIVMEEASGFSLHVTKEQHQRDLQTWYENEGGEGTIDWDIIFSEPSD